MMLILTFFIVITGAIFVFVEGKAFSDANNLTVNLLFAPVLAGILALLSVVANVSTLFLPKLVK